MREVVRSMGSGRTHLADVDPNRTALAESFGATYTRPDAGTRALCGVSLHDGVVMREGTALRCSTCRYLDGIEDNPNPHVPNVRESGSWWVVGCSCGWEQPHHWASEWGAREAWVQHLVDTSTPEEWGVPTVDIDWPRRMT